jgi:hypothetical protein
MDLKGFHIGGYGVVAESEEEAIEMYEKETG